MQTVYFVNAFTTDRPFSGNPAAVCILEQWLPEATLQAVAAQHNLAETAYVVRTGPGQYTIRWFTPSVEIDLCGHATLAAAHILFEHYGEQHQTLAFESASGTLKVSCGVQLTLDFPVRKLTQSDAVQAYQAAFSAPNAPVLYNECAALIECESEQAVRNYTPDFGQLAALPTQIQYLTAAGKHCDFVCRVFAPKLGIPEDPVTGSAYTSLAPYWAHKLNKTVLQAQQLSARGGAVSLALPEPADTGARVLIGGQVQTVIVGEWVIEVSHGH
ncbi:MAG TPA: PhzF family phenazine biosynthesis protein [Marinagarivorans sp.]